MVSLLKRIAFVLISVPCFAQTLPVANGGTGGNTSLTARSNLGINPVLGSPTLCTFNPTWIYGAEPVCTHTSLGYAWVNGQIAPGSSQTQQVTWGAGANQIGTYYQGEGSFPITHFDNLLFVNGGGGAARQTHFQKIGVGDSQLEYWYWGCNSGPQYASDQACQGIVMDGGENGYPVTALSTSASTGIRGFYNLTFSSINCNTYGHGIQAVGGCFPAAGTLIANITQGGPTGQLISASSTVAGAGFIQQMTTNATLPAATAYGPTVPQQFYPVSTPDVPVAATLVVTGGTGTFATGNVCVTTSNGTVEQANITSVSGVAGSQTLNLFLGNPIGAVGVNGSSYLMQGTLTCGWMKFDADDALAGGAPGYIYLGSPNGSTLYYATIGYGATGPSQFTLPRSGAEPQIVSPSYQATHAYAVGDYILDTTHSVVQQITVAGTSAALPTWNAALGGTTTVGTATAVNIGARSSFHVYHAAFVLTDTFVPPVSPSLNFSYTGAMIGPTLMTMTAGDRLDNPNFNTQGLNGIDDSLHCLTPGGCLPASFEAHGMGFSGLASLMHVGNDNPISMYYNATTGLSTGLSAPTLFESSLGPGANSWGSMFIGNAPQANMFYLGNNFPGTTGFWIVNDNNGGAGPCCAASIYDNFLTNTIDIKGSGIKIAGLQQTVANQVAGSCNMAGTASCVINFGPTYVNPLCVVTQQGGTPQAASCSVATHFVTITAAAANSGNWAAMLVGNPN